jgi:uncharacterized protein (DUF433 family)
MAGDQAPITGRLCAPTDIEIALDRLAHHWDAEEIQRQHPHLTLTQIYAALTYYHDHRQHFDSEIRDQLKDVDLIASRQEPSPVRAKLRTARGRMGSRGHL